MSWATRLTLIALILWGGFWTLVLGPGSNPYAFVTVGWWEGMAVIVGVPVGFLWLVLRVSLGDRGALRRPRY